MTPILAAAAPKALWYLTRGTGVVCLVLLTASVVLGVMTSVRWSAPGWPRYLVEGLHKNVSLLVVAFLGVHIATSVIDGFAPIGWIDAIVPFHSPYRPIWLGLGAVACDLLIALIVTSLLRVRLGYRVWRGIHWLAYGSWPIALVHGLGTGSDTRQSWMLLLDAAAVAAVALAVWWRVATGWPAHARVRVAGAAAAVVIPVMVAAWMSLGPLRPGWSHVAGTPSSIIGGTTTNPGGTP